MKTAMILAAGRGERLKPITECIPKALCMINDKPLIVRHVENLVKNGFERIIINHAYLGGKIRQYLGNGSTFGIDIEYSPEPPGGLETGGGIVQALPLLGKQAFITVNADIYTDFNFRTLPSIEPYLAHLVLIKKNPQLGHSGDFGLNLENEVINTPDYTFAGIACYHPRLFKDCKIGRYSITPLLRNLVSEKKISGEIHTGQWFDVGTLKRLASANAFKL